MNPFIPWLCILLMSVFWENIAAEGSRVQPVEYYRYFQLHWPPGAESLKENLLKMLNLYAPELERFFELDSPDTIRIVIVDRRAEWDAYQQQGLPRWAAAAYFSGTQTILMKSPRLGSSLAELEKQFRHELVHAFVDARFSRTPVPRWYNEGLAELWSGAQLDMLSGVKLANALAAGQIVGLDKIEMVNTLPRGKAELAYLQSLSAVLYLRDQLGEENWPAFQRAVARAGWSAALSAFLQVDDIGFEVDWYRYLEERYRWMVVLNLEHLLWVAVVLVLLIGGWFLHLRNRRKLRRWEAEARREPPARDDDPTPPMAPDDAP